MANEFRHEDTATGTTLQRTDWEDVDVHRFDSQATGDIAYASSATQLSRLGIGNAGEMLYVAGGIPTWFNGLTFANDGTVTTILGRAGDYNRIGDAGTQGHGLASEDDLLITGKLEVDGLAFLDADVTLGGNLDVNGNNVNNVSVLYFNYLQCRANALWLAAVNTDDNYFIFKARDNGAGVVEVARLQGAADPYFAMGGSQEFKFHESGITDFAHNVMFSASVDSALVADQVSLGGYEIAAGQRSLAISQENPVVNAAACASDNYLPIRVNGATFKLLLHS